MLSLGVFVLVRNDNCYHFACVDFSWEIWLKNALEKARKYTKSLPLVIILCGYAWCCSVDTYQHMILSIIYF